MPEVRGYELVEYQTSDRGIPFREWLENLKEKSIRARVDARLLRLRLGNFGDAKPVGGGIFELRIDSGPGYRVYYGIQHNRVVVLLLGGTKGTQKRDIENAKGYWARYTAE